MSLTKTLLLEALCALPQARRYALAYSGGRDSHTLLHALASLGAQRPGPVLALHVDHGLQDASGAWAAHCRRICLSLGIDCQVLRLALPPSAGDSPEAQARAARYRALADAMRPGDMLLTAHHQDDQAETVLLQLLRGAGPAGLSAMPALARFGAGWLGRPLLRFTASELASYARQHRLQWVDDPSNRDTGIDRNYLRQQVMPLLRQRWPSCSRTLSRSARHCAEAQSLIDELAAADMLPLVGEDTATLVSSGVAGLPPPRARAVLRAWIRDNGFPLPDSGRLDRILREVVTAAQDRSPLVQWPGAEVRRYRDRLHILPPLPPLEPGLRLPWDGRGPLRLPAGLGCLRTEQGGGGLALERCRSALLEIRFRQPDQGLPPAGRTGAVKLKKLFQRYAIPPWQRSRVPLIFIDGELAAVADLHICRPFAAARGSRGLCIRWDRPQGSGADNASFQHLDVESQLTE